jgi:tol-pal system protein YbgF
MTSKFFFAIVMPFALAACFTSPAQVMKTQTDINDLRADVKTAKAGVEDLKKRLDALEGNVKGASALQKSVADYGVRFDQLAMDIQILQGKVEENNFRLSEIAQKLDDKTYKISELAAKVEELETKVKSLEEDAPVPAAQGKDKKPASKSLEPSEAYRQAKADYDKGNFDLAISGFQNYIKQFPAASQVDAAQYWIGESYYSKKDFTKAIEAFSKVLKTYPKSDKAPAAQLKIGFSYLNEKNNAKAKDYLQRVVKEHPNSKEAALAKDRLGKMGK